MANPTNGGTIYPPLYQAQLRRLLVERFDNQALKTLAFDLGIRLERLPGEGTAAKTQELVAFMMDAGRLAELAAAAERERPKVAWPKPVPAGLENPYKSLLAFSEVDAHLFFGRDAVSDRLVEAIRGRSLLAVLGPSGSGKSSVVFAGLVPRLRRQDGWLVAHFRPGTHPLRSLAGALLDLLDPNLSAVDRIEETNKLAVKLADADLGLVDLAEAILEHQPDRRRLLLIADQFEELYTLAPDEDERSRFLDLIVGDNGQGLTIVLTLRADFLGQALEHRPLAEVLQDNTQMLWSMSRDELESAVVRPAEGQGMTFEEGLVKRILDDVGAGAGTLPLLSFCLAELWSWSGAGQINHVAYEAIGRVDGALANHAEAVFESLDPDDKDGVRQLLLQLVHPGEGTEDTRRLASREELGKLWPLAQTLAGEQARLVVVGRDESGWETAELVHEAILRRWPRLQAWIELDRAFLAWREQLRFALRQWQETGEDEGSLLRGVALSKAIKWLEERDDTLSPDERQYVEASKARDKEALRQRLQLKIYAHEEGWRDLSDADLIKANLSGADLSGADLIGADLREARYDRGTRWPAGFDPKAIGAVLVESDKKR